MTEQDTDLDFDFFGDDEPESSPRQAPRSARHARRRPVVEDGRRGARPRRMRPGPGLTPLLRLAGLIAFGILIIVLFVFWISSCQGASKKSSYKSY